MNTERCSCGEDVIAGVTADGRDVLVEPEPAGKALVLVHGDNEEMPAVFSAETAFRPHRCDDEPRSG